MDKGDVIQAVISKTKARTYLEIGVADGTSFFPLKARRKIAVDPRFAITRAARLKWSFKNPFNAMAEFHESTSDLYFERNPAERFDVVFIDGLHTYAQSLKDALNALDRLNDDGVILLHDCLPPHRAAAHPSPLTREQAAELNIPGWTGEWCGDVWKTILRLRSGWDNLKVCVLDLDYGLALVARGKPDSLLDLTESDLDKMTYEDLAGDKTRLLNLRDMSCLSGFLGSP
ncbi:MAG: class I SAM-dependent methyltransferase [Elusimicrobiota bacterium]